MSHHGLPSLVIGRSLVGWNQGGMNSPYSREDLEFMRSRKIPKIVKPRGNRGPTTTSL
jgi:hypothetical protein